MAKSYSRTRRTGRVIPQRHGMILGLDYRRSLLAVDNNFMDAPDDLPQGSHVAIPPVKSCAPDGLSCGTMVQRC